MLKLASLKMRATRRKLEQKLAAWLRQGISPRRLALTLALGFTIGCVPVIGIPTVLCAALALVLGLNLPAIQAANYAAMPFQLALIAPFVRLGARFFSFNMRPAVATATPAVHFSVLQILGDLGGIAGQALFGWLLVALPSALILTGALTLIFSRIPALSAARPAAQPAD